MSEKVGNLVSPSEELTAAEADDSAVVSDVTFSALRSEFSFEQSILLQKYRKS